MTKKAENLLLENLSSLWQKHLDIMNAHEQTVLIKAENDLWTKPVNETVIVAKNKTIEMNKKFKNIIYENFQEFEKNHLYNIDVYSKNKRVKTKFLVFIKNTINEFNELHHKTVDSKNYDHEKTEIVLWVKEKNN